MSNTIVQITGSFEDWLKRKYGNDLENAKTLDSIDMAECWKLVAEKAKDDLANIDELKKSIWGINCKEFELKLQNALAKTKAAIEGKNLPTETMEETVEEVNTIESKEITSEITNEVNKDIDNTEETEQIEDNTSIMENETETESIEDTNNKEIEEVEEEINIPTHNEEESESTTVESAETEETENDLDAYAKAFEAEVAALRSSEENTNEE